MKRIVYMVLRNLIFIPYFLIKLYYYAAHVDKIPEEKRYQLLRTIVRHANKGGNVSVETYGTENLPKENGFIMYPNHQGMYDVLAIIDSCANPVSAVAKVEVEKVPVLNKVLACMQAFYMDRADVRQSLQVITDVTREVKNKRNYIIFPEGTRSRNGNQLLEFKGGSFKAATKAKCPIVPVALIDSFKPFDVGTIEKVKVQVHFLKPLFYEEYKDMKTNEIAVEVKRRIEEKIEGFMEEPVYEI